MCHNVIILLKQKKKTLNTKNSKRFSIWDVVMWLGLFNHLHNSLLFHHLNWSHVLCQTIYNHVNDLHPFSALPVYTQFN